jgi:hypothetical protein
LLFSSPTPLLRAPADVDVNLPASTTAPFAVSPWTRYTVFPCSEALVKLEEVCSCAVPPQTGLVSVEISLICPASTM